MNTNRFTFVPKDGASVLERKKTMRAYMKRRRGDNANRDMKEILLTQRFLSVLPVNAERIFVYLSFSSEATTDLLIEKLLELGKKVYCPRVNGKTMEAVEYGDDFTLSEFGIREPVGKAYAGEIDAVVVPLLAVDERGARLGYGGGFYDRFLREHPNAKRIGFCYDFQIVDEVPTEETDELLDDIVTDKRSVKTYGGRNNV